MSVVNKDLAIKVINSPKVFTAYKTGRKKLDWVVERVVEFTNELEKQSAALTLEQAEFAKSIFIDRFNPESRASAEVYVTEVCEEAITLSELFDGAVGKVTESQIERIAAEKLAKLQAEEQARLEQQAKAEAASVVNPTPQQPAQQPENSVQTESEQAQRVELEKKLAETLVETLPIHGLAKNSFKKAGILTVQDVLDYKDTGKPLNDINGIADDFANDTIEAIEALRKELLG